VKVFVIMCGLLCIPLLCIPLSGHAKTNLECSSELTKGLARFKISSLPPLYEALNVKKESSKFKTNMKSDQGYVFPKTLWQGSDNLGLDYKETFKEYSEFQTHGSPIAPQNVLVYKKGNRIGGFSVREGAKFTTYTLDENCNTIRVSENNLLNAGDTMAITKKFCSRSEASWIKLAKNAEALKREDALESKSCKDAGGTWEMVGCRCETSLREGSKVRYLTNAALEDCNGLQYANRYVLENNISQERAVHVGRLTEERVRALKELCANNADVFNGSEPNQPLTEGIAPAIR
jgi:hypothetical protein